MSDTSTASTRVGNIRESVFTEEIELQVASSFLRLNLPMYCLLRFSDKAIRDALTLESVRYSLNKKSIDELKEAGFTL